MPLAVGSNTLYVALVFLAPTALGALLPIRARWLVAAGLVLGAAFYVAAVAGDDDSDDLGAVATAVVVLFLVLVWSAGVAAGRFLAKALRTR